jgi:hypothetical protein
MTARATYAPTGMCVRGIEAAAARLCASASGACNVPGMVWSAGPSGPAATSNATDARANSAGTSENSST